MKIEKNKLTKVIWTSKKFGNSLCVDNVDGLILDTIKVFGKIPNDSYQEVSFWIRVMNGKTIICPEVYASEFYVFAYRAAKANVVEIKAEDYIERNATIDGSYEFILNDGVEIEE